MSTTLNLLKLELIHEHGWLESVVQHVTAIYCKDLKGGKVKMCVRTVSEETWSTSVKCVRSRVVNGSDWPDATEITEHKAWILYDAKTLRSVNKLIRKKYISLERDHYAIACQQHVPADETGDIFELDDDKDLKNGYVVVNTQNILLVGFNVEESNGKFKISQKTRAEILRHCLVSFTNG